MNRRPQRLPHRWWRQKTFAWTTGKILGCSTPHLHHRASSTSQCVLCIQKTMTYQWPLYCPPQSSSSLHVPRASWGECRSELNATDGRTWQWGKTKQTLWHKHTHTYECMHTDAQSYTAPLKYVAVYMYSISTMYSLRCCTLHADL